MTDVRCWSDDSCAGRGRICGYSHSLGLHAVCISPLYNTALLPLVCSGPYSTPAVGLFGWAPSRVVCGSSVCVTLREVSGPDQMLRNHPMEPFYNSGNLTLC